MSIKMKSMQCVKLAVLSTALLMVGNAFAAGWTNVLDGNIRQLGQSLIGVLIMAGVVGGIAAILYGGKLWWDKANNRTGDDVKAMSIVFSMVAGAFMLALSFVAVTTVETLGGSQSDVGDTSKIRIR